MSAPPLFSDWLSLGVVLVSLTCTWLAMIWLLRTIISMLTTMRDWQNSALQQVLQRLDTLQDDHGRSLDLVMSGHRKTLDALAKEKDRHHDDHKAILLALEKLIGKCERILDKAA